MLTDFWKDITAFGSLAMSLILIAASIALGKNGLAVLLIVALALCYAIGFPIKVFFFKRRPNGQKYSSLLEKYEASSFPSVHTMRAVSFAIVLSASLESVLFAAIAGAIVLGVMYTRVRLQKHYWTDVLWGAVLGIIVGGLVLLLHSISIVGEFGLL